MGGRVVYTVGAPACPAAADELSPALQLLQLYPEMPREAITWRFHPSLGPGPRVVLPESVAGNFPCVVSPGPRLGDWAFVGTLPKVCVHTTWCRGRG